MIKQILYIFLRRGIHIITCYKRAVARGAKIMEFVFSAHSSIKYKKTRVLFVCLLLTALVNTSASGGFSRLLPAIN